MAGRRLWNIALVLLLVLSFLFGIYLRWTLQPGPVGINPQARIDPSKHYTLTLWDFARPFPGNDSYQEALEATLEDFYRRFPNVTVHIELLDWGEGAERIAAALRQGEPPDVLGTGPLVELEFGPLQVPWTPYAQEGELESYAGPALGGVRVGSELVAWPRWVTLPLWAGNEDLLAAAGIGLSEIQAAGWTWPEFIRAAHRLQEHSAGTLLFSSWDLVSLWGEIRRDVTYKGEEGLEEAAQRALLLRDVGGVPHRVGLKGYSGLEDFFGGRIAMFGPVEPWFLRAVRERSERVQRGTLLPVGLPPFSVALIPPPGVGEGEPLPLTQEVLVVFRQRRYRGDDQTRLAMELARYLSQNAAHLGAGLDLIPAYTPVAKNWCQEWDVGDGRLLLNWLQYSEPLRDSPQAGEREELANLLADFWAGYISAADLAAEVKK